MYLMLLCINCLYVSLIMTKYITCKSNIILQRFSLALRSLSLEIIIVHSIATIVFVQQQLFQLYYKSTEDVMINLVALDCTFLFVSKKYCMIKSGI